jgi:hypothetical protein
VKNAIRAIRVIRGSLPAGLPPLAPLRQNFYTEPPIFIQIPRRLPFLDNYSGQISASLPAEVLVGQ